MTAAARAACEVVASKPKKKCCQSRPRCKRCPVRLKLLQAKKAAAKKKL
jgi:hypothetical protein